MTIRSKWMDPDFRRDSRTPHFCVICQRDLKPGQPHRQVRFQLDRYEAIHPSEWDNLPSNVETGLIGMDCARRLGLEWSCEKAD